MWACTVICVNFNEQQYTTSISTIENYNPSGIPTNRRADRPPKLYLLFTIGIQLLRSFIHFTQNRAQFPESIVSLS